MALFKKDKLPDLPSPPDKVPDFSDDSQNVKNVDEDFPSYTPAVNFDQEGFDNKPKISSMPLPEFPREDMEEPRMNFEKKPLFIKIDKYENAMTVLNSIKEKLNEANNIISELRQIRKDEDQQLDEWSEHVRTIKEKLMNVDSMLFE